MRKNPLISTALCKIIELVSLTDDNMAEGKANSIIIMLTGRGEHYSVFAERGIYGNSKKEPGGLAGRWPLSGIYQEGGEI